MKRTRTKRDRRPIQDQCRKVQAAILEKVAQEYEFEVAKIGNFHFAVHAANTRSMATLRRITQEAEPGTNTCVAALALAVFGMNLYDEAHETLMLNTDRVVGQAVETGAGHFEIKFTHAPSMNMINKVATARESTHAEALSVLMKGAAAALEIHETVRETETGRRTPIH
ncbi:MAG: hypothetical protein OXG35_06125 [Acidobacteria bacterium]|nr:hypothetical protein [Acidobacteriota bacterium]